MTTDETLPFEGRSALVTGASRGIGRAIALGLASRGADVALVARSVDELEEAATSIRDAGGVALVFPADVGDLAAIAHVAERAVAEFGHIDILVNNAGVVWPMAPTRSVAGAEWAAAIAVNLTGAVNLTIALLPAMLERKWGRIVNVSSGVVARPTGMAGANAYVTSKAALEAHTLNLAAELAGSGVTVNAYRPGGVDTGMQGWIRSQPAEQVGADLQARFIENYESGSLLTPDDSAASLLRRIPSGETGAIWDIQDA